MNNEKVILKLFLSPLILLIIAGSCIEHEKEPQEDLQIRTLQVTATAYNSLELQGVGDPTITAWGDTLRPGMKSIAVSRDLLKQGLTYGTPVKIEGLDGYYIVNDKMNSRWTNKIDIYMGTNKQEALNWGRRVVQITFPDPARN